MRRVIFALLLILAGGMAYIRLAPDDPARWHIAAEDRLGVAGQDQGAPLPDRVTASANAAHITATVRATTVSAVLDRLDQIALATPHTYRLAGAPEEGRITWVTRSFFFGFPDYTTANARQDGPDVVLEIDARARYGRGDFGVNAARLRDWLARFTGP